MIEMVPRESSAMLPVSGTVSIAWLMLSGSGTVSRASIGAEQLVSSMAKIEMGSLESRE